MSLRSFTLKITVSAEMITWVAEKLNCNRKDAFAAIRTAYESALLDGALGTKSLAFDKHMKYVVLADEEQIHRFDENHVWKGRL